MVVTLSFAIKALRKAPKSDGIVPSCGPHGAVRKVSEGSGEGWRALGTISAKMSLEEAAVSLGGKAGLSPSRLGRGSGCPRAAVRTAFRGEAPCGSEQPSFQSH